MKSNQKTFLTIAAVFLGILLLANLNFNRETTIPPTIETPPTIGPTSPLQPIQEPKWTLEDAVKGITADTLKKHVYYLASTELDGRKPGTDGFKKAIEYCKKLWDDAGIETEFQPVPSYENNLIGWIEGENSKEIIVIGAHLDHLGNGRLGADDNASGSAAVLEIGLAFAKFKDLKRTVVFQLYTGEEAGLVGSRYYCNHPTFPKPSPDPANGNTLPSHIAMLNLDMIGRIGTGYNLAAENDGKLSPDLSQIIDQVGQKYPSAKRYAGRGGSSGSDHASFARKRVPVMMMHTGLHRDYHKTSDTADKINYQGMEEITRFTFEVAWNVVQSDAKPVYLGEPSPYPTYDHGDRNTPFPERPR